MFGEICPTYGEGIEAGGNGAIPVAAASQRNDRSSSCLEGLDGDHGSVLLFFPFSLGVSFSIIHDQKGSSIPKHNVIDNLHLIFLTIISIASRSRCSDSEILTYCCCGCHPSIFLLRLLFPSTCSRLVLCFVLSYNPQVFNMSKTCCKRWGLLVFFFLLIS